MDALTASRVQQCSSGCSHCFKSAAMQQVLHSLMSPAEGAAIALSRSRTAEAACPTSCLESRALRLSEVWDRFSCACKPV